MVGIIAMPQQLIIGMPAQVIMQDMPLPIMEVSIVHMSFIMSIVMPSPGSIVHSMPLSVMAQVMRLFIGIIIAIGMVGIPLMFIGVGDMVCIGIAVVMKVSVKVIEQLHSRI
jgi:hypothetical protein